MRGERERRRRGGREGERENLHPNPVTGLLASSSSCTKLANRAQHTGLLKESICEMSSPAEENSVGVSYGQRPLGK